MDYSNNQQLATQLQQLATARTSLVRVQSMVKSTENRDGWLLEIGAGLDDERRNRPAFLLVAGIEGNDLAGTASAVAWAEHLASGFESDATIKKLLETTTIYIFPRLNPDAAEHFFLNPKRDTGVSHRPTDDDHDGLVDEDGPDDLNGDGLITSMRVQDPEGEYILDPADPRLLIKADRAKGEAGAWRLLTEGRDDDSDGQFNEDGQGGVNFNRNFPYDHRFFASDAGLHQVSEAETRALAEFIVNHSNIGMVFTFGAADSLVQAPKGDDKSEKIEGIGDTHRGGRKPATGIHNDDVPYYRELGKVYRDRIGLKKELTSQSEPGTFSDWMYFHRGRLSLAARPWTPALQLELAKAQKESATKEEKKDGDTKTEKADANADAKLPDKPSPESKDAEKAKADAEKRNEDERAFVKWLDSNAPEAFVPWKEFQHPDLPGQKVEIGGFAPFARSNPPPKLLNDLTAKHAKFLTELAGRFPRIGIRKAEAKHLGESVYELTLRIENTGYLPTALAQGVLTREVLPTRVVLKLDDKEILSGRRVTLFGAIEGSGGSRELRYVVFAKERKAIDVEVIANLGGTARASITLNSP
ncbi:MAG: M14 family metallopeptidase [Verrucomicrobiales bacterium]|nr:M14 family metallopeptidase [Verrucomicrobiales bacterium]